MGREVPQGVRWPGPGQVAAEDGGKESAVGRPSFGAERSRVLRGCSRLFDETFVFLRSS